MDAEARQQRTNLIFAIIFLVFSALLMGINLFLRFGPVAEWSDKLTTEQSQIDDAKKKQTVLMQDGLKDLADRYSAGMGAVQSIFAARDAVFSGPLDNDALKPVMMLNSPQFFDYFQKLLSKKAVMSNLTIGNGGDVDFVVKTGSYLEAGRQIAALRFGTHQGKTSDSPLFNHFNISSVAIMANPGDDSVPEILRSEPLIASFSVQAKINPDYFHPLK
jgi:hypothetical protein